ncbi:MAG: phosphomannomutase, partial [Nitrospiraceae bacterium]|nr:phosphomannomutase [Nitrospiraceae bacterium]
MSIFRKYDIRGVYPDELNEKTSALIAKAFFQYMNENFKVTSFVVGYDERLSSPKIKKAVVKALTESGADIFDLGMVTTPLVNFGIAHYNRKAGIIITASHNPKEYNGM